MKAIQFHEYGDADVLRLENLPVPELKPGEVLIRVEATGINFADILQRRNIYVYTPQLPFTPGFEVAGTIEKLGAEVSSSLLGQRVVALVQNGGYAEYVVAPHYLTKFLPKDIDFDLGSAILLQGLTAFHMLKTVAHINSKQIVLVHSGAGGVGTLAVQLAKLLGAKHVIATAGSLEKLEIAKSLGADSLLNYRDPDWQEQVLRATDGKGVDVILEAVGGEVFHKSLECLATGGQLIVYGRSSGSTVFDPTVLINKNQTVTGFWLNWFLEKPLQYTESLNTLFEYIKQGQLKVNIGGVFPLEQATKAHQLLESRSTQGKLILKP
ncbi:quinone oxidoreductase [Nostoc sp. DedQUE09]|uniref:quinone oxidoreductase family protein n=1 Tax=Nostoc sp. DedQUE09 TaxID=3075394 RepID=UPI002AD4A9C1|nr:quinone oxidoreductase [Nostoc sp. DedQUE09]MDZ7954950.1 quinone oxidoreductase [Nostoc sp. DedQUE09]